MNALGSEPTSYSSRNVNESFAQIGSARPIFTYLTTAATVTAIA